MARGELRAVVCTSSLDLGIDWGDIDLVVQIGAPKGAARLLQRIGRANHRLDEPSRALLIPANRFELLECMAAQEALAEQRRSTAASSRRAGSTCWRSTSTAWPAPGRSMPTPSTAEVRGAAPYAGSDPAPTSTRVLDFVATGGYALRAYDRYRRLVRGPDGLWRLADGRLARQYRMNVGTIVEAAGDAGAPRQRRGRRLGEVEEYFVAMLTPGDTFIFAGRLLRFEGIRDNEVDRQRWRRSGAIRRCRPMPAGGCR